MSSEKKTNPSLSSAEQIKILSNQESNYSSIPEFQEKLSETRLYPLISTKVELMQVNTGKLCNQECIHCHVGAGPQREEIMTRATMQHCLDAMNNSGIREVDITGGAPEMNPYLKWFVQECSRSGIKVMVRCNLTILTRKKYAHLPVFYATHDVHLVCSLPYYSAVKTDLVRGDGVFKISIKALKMLNMAGYGNTDKNLVLDLVYNPSGAFLPEPQKCLENQFRKILLDKFGIRFNNLYALANMPVGRFLEYLTGSGDYEDYMDLLCNAYNPGAAEKAMCRNMISVGWDGYLYDCDFNQMLDLKISSEDNHISRFNMQSLDRREIILNRHCYGCAAGAGSSCGGATDILLSGAN
jgi:radical SAM/Cys-rich protein